MRHRKTNLKGMICALLSGAMLMASVAPASAATARATTMKLEKTEGTVTLKTQNGSARKISNGMRLYNGNTLSTEKYSYAYVNLDDTKAVKLDQSSSATLRQSGNQLELLVKSGKLFFNVSKKLDSKESMNVRTSTMVTGVRGTCGVVEYVDVNKSKLYLIEGKVTLGSGNNATTVYGGQTATVVLQPKQETGGSEQPGGEGKPGESEKPGETDKEMEQKVMVEKLTEKTIPPVALQEIVANPVLQEKIEKTTELKIEKIEEALEQFEKEEAERIEQEKAEQEKEEEKDKDKEQEDKKENENTTSSGGGSYSPSTPSTPAPTSVTLSGTVSAAAINAALANYSTVTVAARANVTADEAVETNVSLEADVEVPLGKVLIMETGKISGSEKLKSGNGTLIDKGYIMGIEQPPLLSISGMVTNIYAEKLNAQVADYITELAKSSSITATFQKDALVTSNISLSGSSNQLTLDMSTYMLKIESGTLTLASNVSISGSSAEATVCLAGGNLVMQGTSTSAEIKNTESGYAIVRSTDTGLVTWNDTGMSVFGADGAGTAIKGAEVAGETVKLPGWVKTNYVPAWQNNQVVLYSVPAEFTSGTVSASELNQALNVYQTVTVGENAKANLSSSDTVTVPTGKTLTIESKVTQVGTNQYSGGFYLGKSTSLILGEKAALYVDGNGFLGGNGIITVGAGATISVNSDCTMHADEINLTNGSSITNNGTIDGGTLSLEGTGTIENHALIKMKTCEANGDSNYLYVDENSESILVLDGYGFSNSPFTGISRLACVMASNDPSDEKNYFKPIVSVYANKLNQRAANLMRGNQMINGEQVVQVNVSKDVEVMDDIIWDLGGAGVGMYTYKVNVSAGKTLILKNINSFGGIGKTVIRLQDKATLTVAAGDISGRTPVISLKETDKYVIAVPGSATIHLNDPGLKIRVGSTADHIIQGMEVAGDKVVIPGWVTSTSELTAGSDTNYNWLLVGKTDTPGTGNTSKTTLSGEVTCSQMNDALAANQEVTLEGTAVLNEGEQVLIPANKTLVVAKDSDITGEGTFSLGLGAILENNGHIQAATISDATSLIDSTTAANYVKNSGWIKLSGTYASDVEYTYSEDSLLICGDSAPTLDAELMMIDALESTSSSTNGKFNYLYGSYLNTYVADYLYERSQSGYVSGSFQRNITVNSDVTVKGSGGTDGGVQLYMSRHTICVASGTLTLEGDINVTSDGSQPTISLAGGHLLMTGVSTSMDAVIHNMGSGYAIAVSNGSTITWENPDMPVIADSGNGRVIEGVTYDDDNQPIVPDFMTLKVGTLELTLDQTTLQCNTDPTEMRLNGGVSLSLIRENLGQYDRVLIADGANLILEETDQELLIPAGKELVVYGTQQQLASIKIQVGDGSKKALLRVPECAELTVGDISVSSGSSLENYGKLCAKNLLSDGGATIKNTDLIKLSGAYTSGGEDIYDDKNYDEATGMLISGDDSTAMPRDQLLMKVQVTTDSEATPVENRVYAAALSEAVIDYLNECTLSGKVEADFCKDCEVSLYYKSIDSEENDLILNLGDNSLHIVDGELLIGKSVYISSSNLQQTILLEGSGSLTIQSDASGLLICNNGGGYAIARAENATGKVTWNYSDQSDSYIGADSLEHAIQGCKRSEDDNSIVLPDYVFAEGLLEYSDGRLCQANPNKETTLNGTVTPAMIEEAFQKNRTVIIDSEAVLTFEDNDALTIPGGRNLKIREPQAIPETTTIQVGDGITASYLFVERTVSAGSIIVATNSALYNSDSTLICTELKGCEKSKIWNEEEAVLKVSGNLDLAKGAQFGNNDTVHVGGTIHLSEGVTFQTVKLLTGTNLNSDGGAVINNQGLIRLSGEYTSAGEDVYPDEKNALFVVGKESAALPGELLLCTEQILVDGDVVQASNYVYATYFSNRVADYLEDRAKIGNVNVSFHKDVIVKTCMTIASSKNTIQMQLGEKSLYINSADMTIGTNIQIHSQNPDQTILLKGSANLYIKDYAENMQISNDSATGFAIARADDASGIVQWKSGSQDEENTFLEAATMEKTIKGCGKNEDGTIYMPEYVETDAILHAAGGKLYFYDTYRPTTFDGTVTLAMIENAFKEYGSVHIDDSATLQIDEDSTLFIPGGKLLEIYGIQVFPTSMNIQVGDGKKEATLYVYGTVTVGAITIASSSGLDNYGTLNCTAITCEEDSACKNWNSYNISDTLQLSKGATLTNSGTLCAKDLVRDEGATIVNEGQITINGLDYNI